MTLTTRTVTNLGDPLCAPDGTPQAGITITFTLSSARGLPLDAWDASTGERVTGIKTAITDASGEFSVDLWPTDRSNTAVQYLCRVSLPGVRNFMASLPSGSGAFSWGQMLASGLPLTATQLDILDTYRAGFDAAAVTAADNAARALAIFGDASAVAAAVALDKQATSADRVQTGLDRTATTSDRGQTGQDRTATGGDRTQTVADRVQTGQDKSAVTASAAQVAQDRTATAADRVQTGLDKTATAADRVQTGLDKSATAADRVQTGLDKAATAADRIQTGLDKSAAAADRVQTGLDRIAGSTSAGQSAASAAAALATQTAINDIYYGARSSDPATKPSGAARAVGDEYFYTGGIPNLLKRWNGATWQASDIRTADLATSGGAGLVGWIRSAVGAVATTLSKLLGWQDVSVFEFMTDAQIADVKARTLLIDVTVAVQAAIDATTASGEVLKLKGWMKVTDTLKIKQGSQLKGSNLFPSDWRVPGMPGTKIKLVSTLNKDLLAVDQVTLDQGYVWGMSVSNLTLEGSDIAGSKGMNLNSAASSVFENIGISRFGRGVDIDNAMMNTFNRVNSSKCLQSSFYVSGASVTTSQVFNQCVGRESPWSWIFESTATGYSIGNILNNCLIESTTAGGVRQDKSCSVEYIGIYAENTPDDRVAPAGTMFDLFNSGVDVSSYDSIAIFRGGNLAGGNFSLFAGSNILKIGAARYVGIDGTLMRRATNGIVCDATTPANSVYLSGPQFVQVTNPYVGTAGKLCGIYPSVNLSGAPISTSRMGYLSVTHSAKLAGDTRLAFNEARADVGQTVNVVINDAASPNIEFTNSAGTRMALLTNTGNFYIPGAIGAGGNSAVIRSVTGSRGGNAALASLLTQLTASGFIADNTTA